MLLQGESLTAFKVSLQEAHTGNNGDKDLLMSEHINMAMEAVSQMVFPHRALETQKLWMNHCMYKPHLLMTQGTSAAISRLNNALPHFPRGNEANKFMENALVGLLEWSLPSLWREQFNLKGYIPT